MNMKMQLSLALSLALLSTAAFANSACDNPQDDFDGLYCLNKVYQESDKELNENYKTLVAKLDKLGRTKLKRGQLEWITIRNSTCSRQDKDGFLVNLKCATDTTIQRAQFLQDRVRECKSSGCLNSRL